jgi:hypothetical protein
MQKAAGRGRFNARFPKASFHQCVSAGSENEGRNKAIAPYVCQMSLVDHKQPQTARLSLRRRNGKSSMVARQSRNGGRRLAGSFSVRGSF